MILRLLDQRVDKKIGRAGMDFGVVAAHQSQSEDGHTGLRTIAVGA